MNIVFAGTPEFAARHLQALVDSEHTIAAVITQPDKPGKRGKKPQPSPVKVLAETLGIEVRQPEKLRSTDIADLNPDIMVVVAYGQILRSKVLNLPRLGCINVHASLLPRWRGAAPIQRAILAGDAETGVCIMQMDKGLDTGAVINTTAVAISPEDNTRSLSHKLEQVGGPALQKTLAELQQGTATWTEQDEAGMTYAAKIDKSECQLDWGEAAVVIHRKIHAFNPDPVAYTSLGDMRVKMWDSAQQGSDNPSKRAGAPGEIVDVSKSGVLVACGEGNLLVTALQLPIGKGSILSGADILNARSDLIFPGGRFGS